MIAGTRGFALIAVLWVVVALSGLAISVTSHAEVGVAAASARIAGVRGRWAAEACLALAQSRLDARTPGVPLLPLPVDSLDLADGSRCQVAMVDSTEAPDSIGRGPMGGRQTGRVFAVAHGWSPASAGGGARIGVLFVDAGSRAAPVRRRHL